MTSPDLDLDLDKDLLEILACPETKEPVAVADADLISRVNTAIEAGTLNSRDGQKIEKALDGGLLRQDGKVLYPVRGGIPIMLIDEAILIESLPA
jgi:uncharacterized protein YbaR (Trm112 family)